MGCEHSKHLVSRHPSVAFGDSCSVKFSEVDQKILDLWNRYLRGECKAWKLLVDDVKVRRRMNPALFWSEDFKVRLVTNIANKHPFIAMELQSRPLKVMSRILCGMMKFCLINLVTYDYGGENQADRARQLAKIGRHHCKWDVQDESYINVFHAMIGSMRICLGDELLPEYEERLLLKFNRIKNTIEQAQWDFEKANPEEAKILRQEGIDRIEELKQQQLDGSYRSHSSHGHGRSKRRLFGHNNNNKSQNSSSKSNKSIQPPKPQEQLPIANVEITQD